MHRLGRGSRASLSTVVQCRGAVPSLPLRAVPLLTSARRYGSALYNSAALDSHARRTHEQFERRRHRTLPHSSPAGNSTRRDDLAAADDAMRNPSTSNPTRWTDAAADGAVCDAYATTTAGGARRRRLLRASWHSIGLHPDG